MSGIRILSTSRQIIIKLGVSYLALHILFTSPVACNSGNYDITYEVIARKFRASVELFWIVKNGHDIDRFACISKKYLRSCLFHSLRKIATWAPCVLLDDVILFLTGAVIYSTHTFLPRVDVIHPALALRTEWEGLVWDETMTHVRGTHWFVDSTVLLT